jgi:transcriptional regulator with XRE-family HTH domain
MSRLAPEHIRAARYLLGWTATEFAKACMLSESTIRRFEQGLTPRLQQRTERDIRKVLEEQGIVIEPGESTDPAVICSDGFVVRRSSM